MTTRNLSLVTLIVIAAVLLVGCSSTAPSVSESTATPAATASTPSTPAVPSTASAAPAIGDSAIMTVYRKKGFVGAMLNTSVYVDGTEIAELDPGTFVKVKLTPGTHRVWSDEEDDAVNVTAEAGKTYFFRMVLATGMWKGHGKMVAVDEATGSKEFAEYQCKPADQIKVPEMIAR
jgi:hypothetical protein